MIVMGDEVRRSQRGNNNAYCQDNETSWFDWTLLEKHTDVHRFFTRLAARRVLRSVEPELRHESLSQLLRRGKKAWHGVKLNQPDWSRSSHSLAFTSAMEVTGGNLLLHVIFNAYWEPLEFELPTLEGLFWRRTIDTALDPPDDIVDWPKAPAVRDSTYQAHPRSVVVLIADPTAYAESAVPGGHLGFV